MYELSESQRCTNIDRMLKLANLLISSKFILYIQKIYGRYVTLKCKKAYVFGFSTLRNATVY